MFGLIAHFEHKEWGYEPGPKKALLQYFYYTAKAFGADKLCFVDIDDQLASPSDGYIQVEESFDKAKTHFPGCKLVMLSMTGEPLRYFEHPKDACYVIGSDFGREFKHEPHQDDIHICIPQADTGYPLWSHVTAGIILHHRAMSL